jgi:hypothetical protein
VIIRAQCLVAYWPGNCGLLVAGSATAGAGHGLRRLGVGCEDADCSASSAGGAFGRHGGLHGCVNADGPHVVVLGALSTSAMNYLASPDRLPDAGIARGPAETWLSLGHHASGSPGRFQPHRREVALLAGGQEHRLASRAEQEPALTRPAAVPSFGGRPTSPLPQTEPLVSVGVGLPT